MNIINNAYAIGICGKDLVLQTAGKIYVRVKDKYYELPFTDSPESETVPDIIILNTKQDVESLIYPGDNKLILTLDGGMFITANSVITEWTYEVAITNLELDELKVNNAVEIETLSTQAPFIINSSALVNNLNVQYLNGYTSDDFAVKSDTQTVSGLWTFEDVIIRGKVYTNADNRTSIDFINSKIVIDTLVVKNLQWSSAEGLVTSVNGEGGDVTLSAIDVSAVPIVAATLSTAEQAQARENINVNSKEEVDTLINNVQFNIEGFIDSLGIYWNNASYVCTPYILITPGLEVTTSRRNNVEGLFFYNEHYSPLSSYEDIEIDSIVTVNLDDIIIPNNAKYIRCSALKSKVNDVFYKNADIVTNINESTSNNQLISLSISKEYVNINGAFYADDFYDRTPFLPILNYEIYGRQTTNTNLVYFYDINYNPISGAKEEIENLPAVTSSYRRFNLLDLTIPENAEYCVICSYNNGSFPAYVSKIQPMEIYEELQKRETKIVSLLGDIPVSVGTVVNYNETNPEDIKKGYITTNGAYIYEETNWQCVEFMVAPKGKILYSGYINSGASIVLYNIEKEIIGYINKPTGETNFEIDMPSDVTYWSLSSRDHTDIKYEVLESYIDTFTRDEVLELTTVKETSPIFEVYNNMSTEEDGLNNVEVINYGESGASCKITQSISTRESFRIGFKFKIDENPNVANYDKELVRFDGNDGVYLTFNLKGDTLTQLEGNDITPGRTPSNIITSPPTPRYTSGYKLTSNTTGSLSYIYNTVLKDRTFVMPGEDADKGLCYKPITGDDIFKVKLSAISAGEINRDTRSTGVQTIYESYPNLVVGVDDTSVYIKNGDTILHQVLNSEFTTYIDYINAIQDLNGLIINNELLIEVEVLDYYINRNIADIQNFEAKVITKYPDTDNGSDAFFYDSFPVYFTYAIDESWHTFEYLQFENNGRVCIDGQYLNWASPVNYKISNLSGHIGDSFEVSFGHGATITLSDLTIQKGLLNDVEFRTDNHYIISKYHPYMIHSYYHELINADIKKSGFNRSFISDGGDVSDEYAGPIGYGGDGNVNVDRVQLTNPNYIFKQGLNRLRNCGFIYPTKEECRRWATQGISDHRKMIVIDSDDHNSQLIFTNPKTRGLFAKYNAKITNVIELGYYIDETTKLTTYNAVDFIQNYCNDTNTHRLELQKLLQAMINQNWNFDIHGNSNGFDFQTHTYYEIEDVINESLSICQQLGIDASSWCYAANRYTTNAIKMLEYGGFSYATSTNQELSGICHHPLYRPRYVVFGDDIENWFFKIERNIF